MTTVLPAPGTQRRPGLPMTPARIVTLAIAIPLALVIIAATAFAIVAQVGQASYRVGYAIPVRDGQLVADVASGSVTVRQGAGTTARLTGIVQYTFVRPAITETTTASGTAIDVECHINVGNCGLTGTLTVPARTGVRLSSGGGDLTVSGVGGNVTLSSGGGNVMVSGVAGNTSVSSGGGDVTADGLAGRLTFSTGGGNIGGDTLSAAYVHADSAGGDVSLVFTRPPGNLDISSGGGNVNIVLPDGDTAYNVSTSSGGGSVSDPVKISSSAPDKITVDSGGGDIAISQAS
jgi:Putative adhesin